MEELKGCRYCGSEAELVRTKDGSNYWFGRCKAYNCGCRLFARPTREEAAKFWNGTLEEIAKRKA